MRTLRESIERINAHPLRSFTQGFITAGVSLLYSLSRNYKKRLKKESELRERYNSLKDLLDLNDRYYS